MHPIHRMRMKSNFLRIAVILVIKETCTVLHHQDLLVETTNGINNT